MCSCDSLEAEKKAAVAAATGVLQVKWVLCEELIGCIPAVRLLPKTAKRRRAAALFGKHEVRQENNQPALEQQASWKPIRSVLASTYSGCAQQEST
jgi:hypothetical protein